MSEIYSNHHLKIIQSQANNIFRIELKKPNPVFLLSLTKFVKGATTSDDYLLLTFKAYSVEMLTSYLEKPSIYMVANMVNSLVKQLKNMMDHYDVTFIGYNTENIIVIDGDLFIFLDIGLMSEIEEQNSTIYTPFTSSDFFFSPQIKRATLLPLTIHYKTAYFSLGCLLLYVLLSYDDAFYQEYLISDSLNMQQICKKYLSNHPIKDTKLYWLIVRCLVEEPEKRVILFI
jgi:hypothetical protein